ncbi:GIY-YIG catalytic domain containing protein [Ophiocordyceps sinensis CO18]|nr:GIY-YIG catalytic domain containing protein [Ophiocordyceps sinensis CO18]
MVAALKFEWALTNPHISLHIPEELRLAVSTQSKRNGMPKRAAHSLKSVMSNLHLLTVAPSFARWPLNLHFLAREAHAAWEKWTGSSPCPRRPGLRILKDFVASADAAADDTRGIHALPLDYQPIKDYVQRAHDIVSFEREGDCLHCGHELESGKGLHAMCPNGECTAMGHLDCWSRHALEGDADSNVMPDVCKCPSCGEDVRWGDMVKELSLRIRGAKEVERLLKKKKPKKDKATT